MNVLYLLIAFSIGGFAASVVAIVLVIDVYNYIERLIDGVYDTVFDLNNRIRMMKEQ